MKKAIGFIPQIAVLLISQLGIAHGLNIVIPGGTGKFGKFLIPKLSNHDVTVLSRNAFLASAPNRVTSVFGYLGSAFLSKNKHASIRDWDGGDLLDIVGQDWVGWQEDTLSKADIIVHLVGGYTEQRTMATERLVRESISHNSDALHITVTPIEEEIPVVTPGMLTLKTQRLKECEDLVKNNCFNSICLRLEANRIDDGCEQIVSEIKKWQAEKK